MNRLSSERAVLWLPMDGQYDVAGVRSTRNLGRALSAPEHVQVGDGVTAGTFPTQRSPRGMYFDGTNDYCKLPLEPFTVSTPFTLAALIAEPNPNTAFGIIDSVNVGLPNNPGVELAAIGANRLVFVLYSANGSWAQSMAWVGIMPANVLSTNFYCGTYDGSGTGIGMDLYTNGRNVTGARWPNMVTGSVIGGRGFGIGTRWNGAALDIPMTGMGYCFAIYPYQLAANEVFELEYRMRQIARIPR